MWAQLPNKWSADEWPAFFHQWREGRKAKERNQKKSRAVQDWKKKSIAHFLG